MNNYLSETIQRGKRIESEDRLMKYFQNKEP